MSSWKLATVETSLRRASSARVFSRSPLAICRCSVRVSVVDLLADA